MEALNPKLGFKVSATSKPSTYGLDPTLLIFILITISIPILILIRIPILIPLYVQFWFRD